VTNDAPAHDVAESLRQLRLGNAPERLAAARSLTAQATRSDVASLQRIRQREMDHYVQRAIDDAISEARTRPSASTMQDDYSIVETVAQADWDEEAYGQALRATTASLVHELRGPLGLANLSADRGDTTQTKAYLARMDRLLDAMELLAEVASGGAATHFDLGDLVRDIASDHRERFGVEVDVVDASSAFVTTNRGALELIVRNALTNACESSLDSSASHPPAIVVSYGRTDRDGWVSALDRGVGLPAGVYVFAFATSRKDGHDGVGLALARQAAISIKGELTLVNRDGGGAAMQFTWPLAM
jgi:signal transduction histidine kinase